MSWFLIDDSHFQENLGNLKVLLLKGGFLEYPYVPFKLLACDGTCKKIDFQNWVFIM